MGSTIKTSMIFPPSFDVFSSGSDNEIRLGEIFPKPVCLIAENKEFMEFPLWEKS